MPIGAEVWVESDSGVVLISREEPGDEVGECSRTVKNESFDFSDEGVKGAGLVAVDC